MNASRLSKAILVSAILLVGCKFTTTVVKNPVFNEDPKSIQTALGKIVSFENISVNGKETNTNGKINSTLEINIINGQDIPKDGDQMIALGKSIAIVVKKSTEGPE